MSKLKFKKSNGIITVLRAMPYKKCMIYIRSIDDQLFIYDLIFKNQLYSSYIRITPSKDGKKLSEKARNHAIGLILAGATTTIDQLKKEIDESTVKAGQLMEHLTN